MKHSLPVKTASAPSSSSTFVLHSIKDGSESDLDQNSIFSDINSVELDEKTKNEIIERLNENAPSDFEIRMRLMGFNAFNLTGFAIAGIILLLNNILGNGWASDLLGWEVGG